MKAHNKASDNVEWDMWCCEYLKMTPRYLCHAYKTCTANRESTSLSYVHVSHGCEYVKLTWDVFVTDTYEDACSEPGKHVIKLSLIFSLRPPRCEGAPLNDLADTVMARRRIRSRWLLIAAGIVYATHTCQNSHQLVIKEIDAVKCSKVRWSY